MKIFSWLEIKVMGINIWPVIRWIKRNVFMVTPINTNFGLIPDPPDCRDHLYKLRRAGLSSPSTNQRNIADFKYRYDQGQIGSCVGNGEVAAFRRVLQVNGQPDFNASRLFAYYIARQDKDNDTGASIRDGFKAINKYGLCSEALCPYIEDRFADEPCKEAFEDALLHQSITYESVPQIREFIQDAVYHGFPVVYGKTIKSSFMSSQTARTGVVPYPKKCEENLGGHCMTIFDYDEEGTWELNSWGAGWGLQGICHVPWRYVLDPNLCRDFWVFYSLES